MFFSRSYTVVKVITSGTIASVKLHSKHLDKKRNVFLNKADSWRKKIHFPNMLSKNSFSWSFKSKFCLFILYNNCKATSSTFLPFITNNVKIVINSIDIKYATLFIALTHNNYFLYFPINLPVSCITKNFLFVDKSNSSLGLSDSLFFWINFGLLNVVKSWFSSIEKSVYNYVFLKLRYKGKNHRWHRKKKSLVLRFGHSHLISLKKPMSVFLKKKGRMKILFFGTNIVLLYFFLRNIVNWKPANVYTGRGLRISRQKILRKSGKVSIYR